MDGLTSMQQSNRAAVNILRDAGVRAATDITGFGLLGHGAEMASASGLNLEFWPEAVPVLPGARDLMTAGVFSSLQSANESALDGVELSAYSSNVPSVRLLLDPQTSGGLLAAVSPERVQDCLQKLRAAGYLRAAAVGRVVPRNNNDDCWAVLGSQPEK